MRPKKLFKENLSPLRFSARTEYKRAILVKK
jgi:hypothetical protein